MNSIFLFFIYFVVWILLLHFCLHTYRSLSQNRTYRFRNMTKLPTYLQMKEQNINYSISYVNLIIIFEKN